MLSFGKGEKEKNFYEPLVMTALKNPKIIKKWSFLNNRWGARRMEWRAKQKRGFFILSPILLTPTLKKTKEKQKISLRRNILKQKHSLYSSLEGLSNISKQVTSDPAIPRKFEIKWLSRSVCFHEVATEPWITHPTLLRHLFLLNTSLFSNFRSPLQETGQTWMELCLQSPSNPHLDLLLWLQLLFFCCSLSSIQSSAWHPSLQSGQSLVNLLHWAQQISKWRTSGATEICWKGGKKNIFRKSSTSDIMPLKCQQSVDNDDLFCN